MGIGIPSRESPAFFKNSKWEIGMSKRILICIICVILCLSALSCKSQDSALTSIQWKTLTWGVGAPLPLASDFAEGLPEGVTVKYAQEYHFSKTGMYQLEVVATDAKGRELRQTVNFNLVIDNEKPTIDGVKDLVSYVGEGISYRNGISVRDNCGGRVSLEVDSSAVDLQKAGEYPVTYRAVDAAGNVNAITVIAYVYDVRVTEADLYALLDPVIAQNIPSGVSKERQVRAVYEYVYYSIDYTSTSDKSDWVRAAYDGLRTGNGDCYTYFALSKAFFTRLGIENMDMKRTEGLVDERHYWNYVNIGTSESPRWYHYDATQIRGAQHSGCLLTAQQVMAYHKMRVDENGVGQYFYAYDPSLYPASATEIITPTPALEAYY